MKKIFMVAFLSISTFGFANNIEHLKTPNADKNQTLKNNIKQSQKVIDDECSVTSSGTATTSDGTVVNLTLTVTGPCDSSIAQIMRDEIAKVRADMAQI